MCEGTRWWVAVCLAIAMTSGLARADLEAYYSFDEGAGIVAADLSGNRRDGTLEGDPTWVVGPFGSALEFDGTGDHVNIAGYQGVTAVGGVQQPFTVTNWFWITETTGNHEMVTWGNNAGTEALRQSRPPGRSEPSDKSCEVDPVSGPIWQAATGRTCNSGFPSNAKLYHYRTQGHYVGLSSGYSI